MDGGGDARIEIRRGEHLESTHRVHARVATPDGVALSFGDPDRLVFMRSSAKPMQALPLVEDGVLEALGLGDDALALACASHNAEPVHVALAARILAAAGCDEGDLECGGHAPIEPTVAEGRMRQGDVFGPLDSNCSGKHAGMLALCRHRGWATEGYRLPKHPVQRRMAGTIALWTGLPEAEIATAVDGCGVVCFAVPLRAMVDAFLRFASAKPGDAAARVTRAMREHPFLVGGSRRLCTDLTVATGGRILSKVGAEGVYSAWCPDDGAGGRFAVGVKVEDGSRRAVECALVGVLESAGLLEPAELDALAAYRTPPVRNTRGESVGSTAFVAEDAA